VICKKCDLIFQTENLFEKIKDNEILSENIEEVGKEEKTMKISSKDSLDVIVYEWQEINIKEILEVNKRLDRLNRGTLTALARSIDAKSPWTAGHSERVTHLALKIGRVLGLARRQLVNLQQAGLLHDIGKIGIPASILDKPGKLTDQEYRIIYEHPEKGAKILQPIEEYTEVIPMAMQHHEWFNGKGYPDGFSGEEISFGARILAVGDVFDALTSDRPYRDGIPIEIAADMIREGSGTQFDPKVVNAFLKLLVEESVERHTFHMGRIPENIEAFQTI
jgi:putative nucleotidyltransferase with HDIG domain